jgi:hypothetical protein
MLRLAGVFVTVGVALSCVAEQGRATSCVAQIKWGGADYLGREAPREARVPLGGSLGRARVPACGDAIEIIDGVVQPSPDEPDRFVRVRRIRGVPPALAVFDVQGHLVYQAVGYFPQLRSHPLHGLYRNETRPRRLRCGRERRYRGRIPEPPFSGSFSVRFERGRTVGLSVGERTRFSGFLRHGQPYLQRGDRVRVIAKQCLFRWSGTRYRSLIAVSVAP